MRVVEINHAPPRDLNAEAIQQLRAQLIAMQQSLEALKNRPVPTPPKPTQPA
jgi:hypothetical protein